MKFYYELVGFAVYFLALLPIISEKGADFMRNMALSAGAAATFCVLAVLGVAVCAAFLFLLRRDSWRDGDALQ